MSENDKDIQGLTRAQLKAEIERLREKIRDHRDQKGHDRCWLDDQTLYEALPETVPSGTGTLPPEEEFIAGCRRYHHNRKSGVSHEHLSLVQVMRREEDAFDILGRAKLALVAAPAPYNVNPGVLSVILEIDKLRFQNGRSAGIGEVTAVGVLNDLNAPPKDSSVVQPIKTACVQGMHIYEVGRNVCLVCGVRKGP